MDKVSQTDLIKQCATECDLPFKVVKNKINTVNAASERALQPIVSTNPWHFAIRKAAEDLEAQTGRKAHITAVNAEAKKQYNSSRKMAHEEYSQYKASEEFDANFKAAEQKAVTDAYQQLVNRAEACGLEAYSVLLGPKDFSPETGGVIVDTSAAVTAFLNSKDRRDKGYWAANVTAIAYEIRKQNKWGDEKNNLGKKMTADVMKKEFANFFQKKFSEEIRQKYCDYSHRLYSRLLDAMECVNAEYQIEWSIEKPSYVQIKNTGMRKDAMQWLMENASNWKFIRVDQCENVIPISQSLAHPLGYDTIRKDAKWHSVPRWKNSKQLPKEVSDSEIHRGVEDNSTAEFLVSELKQLQGKIGIVPGELGEFLKELDGLTEKKFNHANLSELAKMWPFLRDIEQMKHYAILVYLNSQIGSGKVDDYRKTVQGAYKLLWDQTDIDWERLNQNSDPMEALSSLEKKVCPSNHFVREEKRLIPSADYCWYCQKQDYSPCVCPPYVYEKIEDSSFAVAVCGVELGKYNSVTKACLHALYLYHVMMLEYQLGTQRCEILNILSKSYALGSSKNVSKTYGIAKKFVQDL